MIVMPAKGGIQYSQIPLAICSVSEYQIIRRSLSSGRATSAGPSADDDRVVGTEPIRFPVDEVRAAGLGAAK